MAQRILVVDDDFVSRRILVELLANEGSVEQCADGESAMIALRAAAAASQPFDLVFLDIGMPGLDGHAVLRSLRAMEAAAGRDGWSGAKVVMVTGRADAANMFTAFRNQCECYLVKPVTMAALASCLAQLRLARPA